MANGTTHEIEYDNVVLNVTGFYAPEEKEITVYISFDDKRFESKKECKEHEEQKRFEDNIKSLESARKRLEEFDDDSKLNREDFNLLKREYVLAQVRYWLLARRTKELCKKEIATIIYFYSNDRECPDCGKQAFVLNYLKGLFKDKLLIFSFDAQQKDEPMIPILKHTYNITKYPALIVEGGKFEGLMDKGMILKEICLYYKDEGNCKPYYPSVKNETI